MGITISKAEHDAILAQKEGDFHALLDQADARAASLLKERDGQINALRHELDQLKRLIFGATKERFQPAASPEQLALGFGGEADTTPSATDEQASVQTVTYQRKKKKKHPGRTKLPDTLPVQIIPIEPDEDTTDLVKIGEEITDELEYRPGVLYIKRYVRSKYVRPAAVEVRDAEDRDNPDEEVAIIIGELPERPIPKGIAGAGLLARLMVAKFIDHLPFYRQIEQFKRNHDVIFHKSTINDWFAACCTLLEPLYAALRENVLDTDYLQGDESKIKVLDRAKAKKTHLGWMWVFRNPVSENVFFVYRRGRGANVLHEGATFI